MTLSARVARDALDGPALPAPTRRAGRHVPKGATPGATALSGMPLAPLDTPTGQNQTERKRGGGRGCGASAQWWSSRG
eukprot:10337599-Alexandrium_andersonii.AAC.1